MSLVMHLYLVSDASGETVSHISKAVIAQFDESVEVIEHLFPLIRSHEDIDQIFSIIDTRFKSIILHTIIQHELQVYLEKKANDKNILAIAALKNVIRQIIAFTNAKIKKDCLPGKYNKLDEEYYEKIDILNFTMRHDDGQLLNEYNDADILILGVSRTSKSPTSLYLAQKGYKTANLPIINNIPVNLSGITKPLVIGLTIAEDILCNIRSHRFLLYTSTQESKNNGYAEFSAVREEIQYAMQIFRFHQIPIIDVSRKAIEEVAAEIIKLYNVHNPTHVK